MNHPRQCNQQYFCLSVGYTPKNPTNGWKLPKNWCFGPFVFGGGYLDPLSLGFSSPEASCTLPAATAFPSGIHNSSKVRFKLTHDHQDSKILELHTELMDSFWENHKNYHKVYKNQEFQQEISWFFCPSITIFRSWPKMIINLHPQS